MPLRLSRRSLLVAGPLVLAAVRQRGMPEATPGASPQASPGATPMAAGRPVSVADRVTIELTDSGFRPDYVQATNGHDLHVTLRNTGRRKHAFQIPRLEVDEMVEPGDETTVTIASPPLGDFTFTSNAPGDADFEGTLVFYI